MDVVAVFLLAVLVIGAIGFTRAGWIASAVAAAVTLAFVGLTTWALFTGDGYASNRWEARGGGPHGLYVVAIAVAAALFALLRRSPSAAPAGRSQRRRSCSGA